MNLSELHYQQKNRLARKVSIIISCVIIFFTVSSFQNGVTPIGIFKIILGIYMITSIELLYRKIGTNRRYKYVVTINMAILYPIVVLTSRSAHIYAIMYGIIILVTIYGEVSTVIAGAAVAIITVVASAVVFLRKGTANSDDLAYMIICSVLTCVLAAFVCGQQRRQSAETIKATEDAAAAQLKVSEKIVDLADKLNNKFVSSKESSDLLNEQMEATHKSVLDIVNETRNTAEAVEIQTRQTADISSSISKVGNQATNIEEISNKVEQVVAEGVDLIEQLKNQAKEVATINTETQTTTQALNDSIKDVQDITQTILGISSQTNLLALNASIEAARAGEAGKGFAVVADEIRALSESTREATEQIAGIISKLTEDANRASGAMAKSAEFASKQAELIEETGTKLSDIKEHTGELHDGVVEVNQSVGEVVEANAAIMESISNLSATSKEMTESSDAMLTLSDSTVEALNGMNDNLQEINDISVKMADISQ